MQKATLASRRIGSIAFETHCALGLVDANDSDTDWASASAAELSYLVPQIVDHAIDLLDHGLRENLHFYANLDGGNWSSSNLIAWIENRHFARNNLAKCPIAAASVYASTSILNIQHAILTKDHRIY
jgi:hypothetical protein